MNLLLEATGKEFTFTPKVVLETIVPGKGTEDDKVIATGRDGRILWTGKAHKKSPKEGRKFTFPWFGPNVTGQIERKSKRFSYLVNRLSVEMLPKEAIKPLTRLAVQFHRLKWIDFKGLCKSVLSTLSQKVTFDGHSGVIRSRIKPYLLDKRKVLSSHSGIVVPLWDYRPKEAYVG
uniref:RNA-dependent RNA polymerase n=1 Tax=Beauveria bassiana splipalmivirus 1 TaxID=3096631 RepID=A0AAF1C127_9VIRU|nr:MAG: RNA-dependent RNA polymerase [Beauveria bassiana splipalmivirus 1]